MVVSCPASSSSDVFTSTSCRVNTPSFSPRASTEMKSSPLRPVAEEPIGDYTALIEEEIERYSFGSSDDGEGPSLGKFSRH